MVCWVVVNNTINGAEGFESAHQSNIDDGQMLNLSASCVALREDLTSPWVIDCLPRPLGFSAYVKTVR
jgi:hypothetical protein